MVSGQKRRLALALDDLRVEPGKVQCGAEEHSFRAQTNTPNLIIR